jgi:hypothetical protein
VTVIPSSNTRAIEFNKGIGLKPEGTLRHHFAKGVHACIHGMLKSEFTERWENPRPARRSTGSQDHHGIVQGRISASSAYPAVDRAAADAVEHHTAQANSYLNAINQNTPYGTLKWNETGSAILATGMASSMIFLIWQVNTELSPQQQKIVDAQQAATLGTS